MSGIVGFDAPALFARRRRLHFGVGRQCMVARLLSDATLQLNTVLAPRGGEVARFASVQICPGIERRRIFRHFCCGEVFLAVFIVGSHNCSLYIPLIAYRVYELNEIIWRLPLCNSMRLLWPLSQVNQPQFRS